jgi:magnesium transporter
MITKKTFKGIPYLDVYNPTQDEVKEIMNTYRLDPGVADEILSPTLRSRVERYSDYFYTILHFPSFKQSHTNGVHSQEIDFIISKKFLITVRYDVNESIERFSKNIDVDNVTNKVEITYPSLFLFFKIIDDLYSGSMFELQSAESDLKEIEDNVFAGKEKDMVFELSRFGRNMLEFRQTISTHKDILKSLTKDWSAVFGDTYKHHLDRLLANYFKVKNTHSMVKDTMQEVRLTNNSLLTTKQNETMKVFTILAFVTFPLTLIAGVFGMNTSYTPFVGADNDFWLIIASMGLVTILMFMYFKWKKWL